MTFSCTWRGSSFLEVKALPSQPVWVSSVPGAGLVGGLLPISPQTRGVLSVVCLWQQGQDLMKTAIWGFQASPHPAIFTMTEGPGWWKPSDAHGSHLGPTRPLGPRPQSKCCPRAAWIFREEARWKWRKTCETTPKYCWKIDLVNTGKIYGRGCDQDGWDHV